MGKFQARNLGNGTIQVFLQQRYYLMTEAVVID
jgi:hypothetical protein